MNSNKEVSNEVRQFLNTFKNMIEEIIDAHDKLNNFISNKAPNGCIKDEDIFEYHELSNRFKELTTQFSDKIRDYIQ